MEMFIAVIVLVVAPFGILIALECDVTSEAERAISFFACSRNRVRNGR